jgi:hypothetical protein
LRRSRRRDKRRFNCFLSRARTQFHSVRDGTRNQTRQRRTPERAIKSYAIFRLIQSFAIYILSPLSCRCAP